MRAFKHKEKRTNSCSYCRGTDHRAPECKTAEYDYNEWSNHRVPHKSESWHTWKRHDYTQWIREASKVAVMRRRAQQGRRKPGYRAPPSCGFCGERGHDRRNCEEMKNILAAAKRANENWKKALRDVLVGEEGICEGAAVKVKRKRGWMGRTEEQIGLIVRVNWDEMNFLSCDNNIDHDYRTRLSVDVNIAGESLKLALRYGVDYTTEDQRVVIPHCYHYYNEAELLEVIGKSDRVFDDEWVTNAPEEEFVWLTKKRSLEWLEKNRILKAIQLWDFKK
jgi:hypothetical protein